MNSPVHGLIDMSTILQHRRKLGGAIEAESVRLRTGESFSQVVVVSAERTRDHVYTVGLVTEDGEHLIVHTGEISMIVKPRHVCVKELRNQVYRQQREHELICYLKRLMDVSDGFQSPGVRDEVLRIIEDIGWDAVNEYKEFTFLQKGISA
ncbi:hypothetical protein [Mechercharimyces sp. CAU 1602]|uniref:hypothetical protein n=1 Tax=Mechercharimyces sp. CAU 1602 TaxID=2973933 RepID=UPI00216354D1|nr:hypothetical protein [Mechercharimyces sp. CAU 1602]MCS1350084.1 hypothetical protein [Mechercharimyces sp. CAU 1602]